jgi:hypothetical protein
MGDFGIIALKQALRAVEVSPPPDCVLYGIASKNQQGGLSVEDLQKRSVFEQLRRIYDWGLRQAWLLRLDWQRRVGGLNVAHDADAVRVFPIDFSARYHEPPLGPTQHPVGRLIPLDQLSQTALDRVLNGDAAVPAPAVQPLGDPLAERSDEAIICLRRVGEGTMRLRHNSMTNALKRFCEAKRWAVTEDRHGHDALIANYAGARDVLVEVKTESTSPFVRMAVGQLLDYRRRLPRRNDTDLAVLLQGRPDDDVLSFLADVQIKALWLLDDGGVRGL